MNPALKKGWQLVFHENQFYLSNSNLKKTNWWAIEFIHFYIFTLLDGSHRIEVVAQLVSDRFGCEADFSKTLVEKLLYRFNGAITNLETHRPEVLRANKDLRDSVFEKVRNCAPMRLTWVVTNNCALRCAYCYMDADPVVTAVKDENITPEKIEKLAIEASNLTVCELFLTGGEPFLLKDIYFVINTFLKHRIKVRVTTKYKVDASLINPLSQEDFFIEQSLDSLDNHVNTELTGSKFALRRALNSINSYRQNNINFSIKSVIGKTNLNCFPDLVSLAFENGASKYQAVEYRESLGRNLPDFKLTAPERQWLKNKTIELTKKFKFPIELDLDMKQIRQDGQNSIPGSYCGEGIKTLSFLANGDVTRCPTIPKENDVTYGNIFEKGIYEIWNFDKNYIETVNPSREFYAGKQCVACNEFSICNLSGRCIVKPKMENGHYFDIDRQCDFRQQDFI